MSSPTKAAKAAAILVFTSGVEDHAAALEIYDALQNHGGPVSDVLDRYANVCRWSVVDEMTDEDWREEIVMLAKSIDSARATFGDAA